MMPASFPHHASIFQGFTLAIVSFETPHGITSIFEGIVDSRKLRFGYKVWHLGYGYGWACVLYCAYKFRSIQ